MTRIVDLTLTLRHGMRGVEFETARTVERDGWNARTLHLYSHAGTHMDAQTHFGAGPETIDEIPLQRCLGPAWVVKLDDVAPKALLNLAHLGMVATRFQPGESLLLRTGWSRHADNPQYYRDHFPRISEELARWCVEKKVNMLGVEPPSVADVNNQEELTRIHKILLGGGVTIVEGLANLDALREARVFFAALPLKIDRGDGCPCRALAIEGGEAAYQPRSSAEEVFGSAPVVPGGKDAAPPQSTDDLVFLTAEFTWFEADWVKRKLDEERSGGLPAAKEETKAAGKPRLHA